MTKVYLVWAQECNPDGTLDVTSKKHVARLFTNKKLANKYADYMNQEWKIAFDRNADFKRDKIDFYYVDAREICHIDFSEFPF